MKNTKIVIKTNSKSYPIFFGGNILGKTGYLIKKNLPKVKKIRIICDKKIPKIMVKKLSKSLGKYNTKIYKISATEKIKNFSICQKLIENLLKDNLNRTDCIIAFGGGIVGDITAFVSSLVKRGIKFVNIPSTLLAQVDSAIGGKTGVNSKQGKNLIGTFYQPELIIMDTTVLKSLTRREIICGYAEILKHAIILDEKFFTWLKKNGKQIINNRNNRLLEFAIKKSCKIKSEIIKKDEKEKDLRMILNFGHTFAHGFEGAKNFTKKLNHGEAVLLGMIMACLFSNKKKILSLKNLLLIKKHYFDLKLPMNIKKEFKKKEINKIIHFMKKDKKNIDNKINLILLKKIGNTTKPNSFSVKDAEIKKFLLSQFI